MDDLGVPFFLETPKWTLACIFSSHIHRLNWFPFDFKFQSQSIPILQRWSKRIGNQIQNWMVALFSNNPNWQYWKMLRERNSGFEVGVQGGWSYLEWLHPYHVFCELLALISLRIGHSKWTNATPSQFLHSLWRNLAIGSNFSQRQRHISSRFFWGVRNVDAKWGNWVWYKKVVIQTIQFQAYFVQLQKYLEYFEVFLGIVCMKCYRRQP